jgi:hypothetical protein
MSKAVEGKFSQVDSSYFYRELPKTNCNECGEESCKAFAEKVANQARKMEECPPFLRKRVREDKTERKRLLKALKAENKIYNKEEAYTRANNYGDVIGRLLWLGFSPKKDAEPERHIIVTTEGLALMNQPIFPLKKKWETLTPGARTYPMEKVIDYKKKETFSGLVPFKANFSTTHMFPSSPFLFEVKLIEEKPLAEDNPWISLMSGPRGTLLICFDKNILEPEENRDVKKRVETRVIEVPLTGSTKDSINSFLRLMEYVKNKFDKNRSLTEPTILKNVRRRYSRKFDLEDSLERVEKRLSGYPLNLASEKPKVTKLSSTKNSKHTGKRRGESKKKKTGPKLITWDTSHYEVLRWESDVSELIKIVSKLTGLKINWLKGSWKDELLANKKMLNKNKILVLTGIGSNGKISRKEITAVRNFVADGGALFLSAPEFKGEDTNVLARVFGAEFLWNKIRDEEHHEGNHSDHAIISNFTSHPICKGVKEVCFGDYGGFSIKVKKKAVSIAQTANSSQPPNAVVLAVAEYGRGLVVFFASSTTFKDKYLTMYDNKKLAQNIFSYLSAPPVTLDKTSDENIVIEMPVVPAEESIPTPMEVKPVEQSLPPADIKEEAPVQEKPAIKKPPKPDVSKPKKAEKRPAPEIPVPAPSAEEIEVEMDKLDEKLVLGEIDEVTYEIERIKLMGDLEGLNKLMSEGKINLAKYIEARKIIHSRSSEKLPSVPCSSCGEMLMGIEEFCPNCGEKNK